MNQYLISPNITIMEALKAFERVSSKCLVVVDESNMLLGTVSDGDLRRAILKNPDLGIDIKEIYNKNPVLITSNDKSEDYQNIFLKNKLDVLPLVNKNNKVINVINWHDTFKEAEDRKPLNTSVVIMSGGKGTRMQPFTDVLPKPLIPIKGKTILEHIISQFLEYSINDFYLTLNFKSKIIKAYFEDLDNEYNIEFIEEKEPLGTASSLQLLPNDISSPFFVTNCDTLINLDLNDIYNFHEEGKYEITLVASATKYDIPYGTCVLNSEGELKEISEKPSFNFLVNSGMYLLNSSVMDLIPKTGKYDITTLIEDTIKAGKKVGVFPIKSEDWKDIGQWAEYKKVVEKFN